MESTVWKDGGRERIDRRRVIGVWKFGEGVGESERYGGMEEGTEEGIHQQI